MNIAIVIGVYKYQDQNDLPGCKNDILIMEGLINKINKYEKQLVLKDNEPSIKVKELIVDFLENCKGEEIEEIFFYYTGHGEFYNNEFYFLLSDHDSTKRKQTSLLNNELDNLLRNLNPNLVIKVIDACQSGVSYVKDSSSISKYFKDTESVFKKCYFMNSSSNSQSSFQSTNLSDFTSSFIRAVLHYKTKEVRYKDIIDFISDDFESNNDQTPYFVIQADYLEKFSHINQETAKFLEKSLSGNIKNSITANKSPVLLELIKEEAKYFVTKEEAISCLEKIKSYLSDKKLNEKLSEIYLINFETVDSYDSIKNKKAIGNWLLQNSNIFYAKAKTSLVFDTLQDQFAHIYKGLSLTEKTALPTTQTPNPKSEISGYELTIEVPFKGISIDLNSKYPNISNYNLTLIHILSKKSVRFFYYFANYIEESWNVFVIDSKSIEWKTLETQLIDFTVVQKRLDFIFNGFQEKIQRELEEKFLKPGNETPATKSPPKNTSSKK